MTYEVGDKVVHWTYGVGAVIAIEEIRLAENTRWYYVIDVKNLKLWVPVDEAGKGSLRFPMEKTQFRNLLGSLRTSGQPLPDRPYQRKQALRERMQNRTLDALCLVIRDLIDRSRHHKLSVDDSAVLMAAEDYLLDEWVIVLGMERSHALRDLETLLHQD